MSATNEAIYRRLIEEGFNQGNLEVADELVAPGAIEHQRGGGGDGPVGTKNTIKYCGGRFPTSTSPLTRWSRSATRSGPASAAEAPTWGASPATPRPESKRSPT